MTADDQGQSKSQKNFFQKFRNQAGAQPSETSSVRSGSTTASMLGPLNAGELHNQYDSGKKNIFIRVFIP